MPKVATGNRQPNDQRLVLFCDENCTKRIIVLRPILYSDATKCVLRHFPSISPENLIIQTDELDISSGERADITPETWEIAIETVSRFFVIERGKQLKIIFRYTNENNSGPLTIECTISSTISLQELFEGFEKHIRALEPPIYDGTSPFTYYYNGRSISAESSGSETPQHLKMLDGASIECVIALKQPEVNHIPLYHSPTIPSPFVNPFLSITSTSGDAITPFNQPTSGRFLGGFRKPAVFGKPVIYIFSQEKMDVSVSVSLIPQWSFSALYPVVPIHKPLWSRFHQQIGWEVETQCEGLLREKNTGREIAYLFWEATVNREAPLEDSECFSPVSCDVTPDNSALLSVNALPGYLEKTLTVLGLHTEARTSFITYWLPSFLKHTHIALRFIPQASYDRAAPMEVTPQPDVVVRVFMLFKGVKHPQEAVEWEKAVERSRVTVEFWREVIGSQDLTEDTPRLRILEWGGMEIS